MNQAKLPEERDNRLPGQLQKGTVSAAISSDVQNSQKQKPQLERRQKTDRRETGRQGKYDRRRNRCASCHFFQADPSYCGYHQKAISAQDFACPAFQP